MIPPLRKRTRDGKLYKRDGEIEAKLVELASLSRDDLVAQCKIERCDDPSYIPSECLLHFVRASRKDDSDAYFEQLYKSLAERVLRRLPKAENAGGETLSLTRSQIWEKAFDRFVTLLAEDRLVYCEKLDFFEVRFDLAVAKLRSDAQQSAWREENRSTTLEYDNETGELSVEVEQAAGSFDPFDNSDLDSEAYRFRLDAAIDNLPLLQRRIIEMIRQGIPIESKDSDAMSIAKALNKSEKTIRTHRDKAYAALRTALKLGDEL